LNGLCGANAAAGASSSRHSSDTRDRSSCISLRVYHTTLFCALVRLFRAAECEKASNRAAETVRNLIRWVKEIQGEREKIARRTGKSIDEKANESKIQRREGRRF
jgi:hypothetical protein